MTADDLVTMKNSISIYEKELQKTADFLKKLKAPANEIKDPDILAAITKPSVLRLMDLYEGLLDEYRKYVKELEAKS